MITKPTPVEPVVIAKQPIAIEMKIAETNLSEIEYPDTSTPQIVKSVPIKPVAELLDLTGDSTETLVHDNDEPKIMPDSSGEVLPESKKTKFRFNISAPEFIPEQANLKTPKKQVSFNLSMPRNDKGRKNGRATEWNTDHYRGRSFSRNQNVASQQGNLKPGNKPLNPKSRKKINAQKYLSKEETWPVSISK